MGRAWMIWRLSPRIFAMSGRTSLTAAPALMKPFMPSVGTPATLQASGRGQTMALVSLHISRV